MSSIDKYVITRRITLPRLSMFKPEKGNNFKFIDRQISRMFQAGGTDVYVHKLLGTSNNISGSADQPVYSEESPTNIQDLLLLENRDRKYDQEIYRIRGYYNVQNIDFNLSQFGLFIDNDTLFMTVHINDFINYVGRKPLSGDVLELPHLKDDFALNDFDVSLPRYYVIEDVGRASEGFSATWYPHLYRLRMSKITDSQQFSDILDLPASDDTTLTVRDLLSTRTKELEINDAILNQAEADAPFSGYETQQFFTLAVDKETGKPIIQAPDVAVFDTTIDRFDESAVSFDHIMTNANHRPLRSGYSGYLLGDGMPINGFDFGTGVQFPDNPKNDDFFLRIDFLPNRLFRFNGNSWLRVEDDVRMTMTNNDSRQTLKTSFINNVSYTYNATVDTDIVKLQAGDVVVNTNINYQTSLFVVMSSNTIKLEYVAADFPELFDSYVVNGVDKLKIKLPLINSEQQSIPFDGAWKIALYNYREEQRQSLSKALRPDANF